MRFDLSDDQEFFQRTTRTLLEKESGPNAARALQDDPTGFDPAVWRRGAELGWTSLLVSERFGGGGLSSNPVVDLSLVAEEFGRFVTAGPLVPVNVVIAALAASGTIELQDRVIPSLLTGETIAAWAFAEGDDDWSGTRIATVCRADGQDYLLSGCKRFVEAGAGASHLLVTTMAPEGPTQLIVAADAPGVEITSLQSVDLVRRFATVELHSVRVSRTDVVGSVGEAARDIARQRQLALVLQVAETVGTMDRAFAMTVEYLKDRWSFGRPLASYQALKHRVADMLLVLETAKGCAEAAATAVGEESADADQVVSVAKAYVGLRSLQLVSDAVQLHGGIGLTWEHDLHVLGRRIAINRPLFGSPEEHYERLCAIAEES